MSREQALSLAKAVLKVVTFIWFACEAPLWLLALWLVYFVLHTFHQEFNEQA